MHGNGRNVISKMFYIQYILEIIYTYNNVSKVLKLSGWVCELDKNKRITNGNRWRENNIYKKREKCQ